MAKKILVIDDDRLTREIIRLNLEKEGYRVAIAEKGEEGIEKAREENVDLILLDLILPDLDGFGFLTLKAHEPLIQPIPVIVLTNRECSDYKEKVMSMGASEYLVKYKTPPDELVKKIKQILKE